MSDEKQQKFKYFVVKGIEKKQDKQNNTVLTVPIQSTSADRDGDVINESGQQRIIEQLNSGKVPAFPNHGMGEDMLDVPYGFQQIMGKWVGGYSQDNITYGNLQLREGNTAADNLIDLVEQDMPVGFSIGFVQKDCEEDNSISDLDLLEGSPVGIPSNAAAVYGNNINEVAMAAKSAIEKNGSKEDIKEALKDYTTKFSTSSEIDALKSELSEIKQLLKALQDNDKNQQPIGGKNMSEEQEEQTPNVQEQNQDDYTEQSAEEQQENEEAEQESQQDNSDEEPQSVTEEQEGPGEQDTQEQDTQEQEPSEDEDKSAETETNKSGDEEDDGSSPNPEPKKMKTFESSDGSEEGKNVQDEEPEIRGFRFNY